MAHEFGGCAEGYVVDVLDHVVPARSHAREE